MAVAGREASARAAATQRASVAVAARNLHTWTPFKGLDPENVNAFPNSATFGTIFEQNELPQLATFMFRLNLSF